MSRTEPPWGPWSYDGTFLRTRPGALPPSRVMKGVTYGLLALALLGIVTSGIIIAACIVGFDGVELALRILLGSLATLFLGVFSGVALYNRQQRAKHVEVEVFRPKDSERSLLDGLLEGMLPGFSVKRRRALIDDPIANELIAVFEAARKNTRENAYLTDANLNRLLNEAVEGALLPIQARVEVENSRFEIKDGD